MKELKVYDTGENENFKLMLDNKEINYDGLTSYELKRTAGGITKLILKYDVIIKEIIIDNKKA